MRNSRADAGRENVSPAARIERAPILKLTKARSGGHLIWLFGGAIALGVDLVLSATQIGNQSVALADPSMTQEAHVSGRLVFNRNGAPLLKIVALYRIEDLPHGNRWRTTIKHYFLHYIPPFCKHG